MCYVPHFAPIRCHARKMARNTPLILYVIYWLRINKNFLMKGILVVSTRLTYSMLRSSMITKKGFDRAPWTEDGSVSTMIPRRKQMSQHQTRKIERRKFVITMERWEMWIKPTGRKEKTWKKRSRISKEIWCLFGWPINSWIILPFMLGLPRHYMITPQRVSGFSILGVHIIWLRMLLCTLP